MRPKLPPLDVHAHIHPKIHPDDLLRLGAVVFAATRSLDEYESVSHRHDQVTIWGIGCHPSLPKAQASYDSGRFASLISTTSYVSEIGLDRRSKVPLQEQERVFGSILESLQDVPRITSIHSSGAPGLVLDAIERMPIKGAVLHWWRGDEAQTRRAVELGCRFSVNSAGMSYPDSFAKIPLSRILTETDHPSGNRRSSAPRQPGGVEDVEIALSRVYGIQSADMRKQVWLNFQGLVVETGVEHLLPRAVQRMLLALGVNF